MTFSQKNRFAEPLQEALGGNLAAILSGKSFNRENVSVAQLAGKRRFNI